MVYQVVCRHTCFYQYNLIHLRLMIVYSQYQSLCSFSIAYIHNLNRIIEINLMRLLSLRVAFELSILAKVYPLAVFRLLFTAVIAKVSFYS